MNTGNKLESKQPTTLQNQVPNSEAASINPKHTQAEQANPNSPQSKPKNKGTITGYTRPSKEIQNTATSAPTQQGTPPQPSARKDHPIHHQKKAGTTPPSHRNETQGHHPQTKTGTPNHRRPNQSSGRNTKHNCSNDQTAKRETERAGTHTRDNHRQKAGHQDRQHSPKDPKDKNKDTNRQTTPHRRQEQTT